MSDVILTRGEVAQHLDDLRIAGVTDRVTASCAEVAILDHDAALRARLAEVDADRRLWRAAYEEEVEVGGGRLVEAVELLRDAIACVDALVEETGLPGAALDVYARGFDGLARARAFIEEQGQ